LHSKKDLETELLLNQGLSSKAYNIPPPYSCILLQNCTKIYDVHLKQGSATYGPPSKIIRPAAPLQIVVTMAHVVVLYFMSLPSLQHLVLRTYEEPHWTMNVVYVVFFYFRCEQ